MAEKAFPDSLSEKPIAPETIAWLRQLDPQSLKRTLDQMYWRWTSSDTSGFAEFLKGSNAGEVSPHIYDTVARRLARKNPLDALEWSAQLPAEHALDIGKNIFNEWSGTQPEFALNWLNDLPESDPWRQPLVERVVDLLAHNPKPGDFAAIRLPNALPRDAWSSPCRRQTSGARNC